MADYPAGIQHRRRISGVQHWRWQRYSAAAMLVIMGYFVYVMATLGTLDYAGAVGFVSTPLHAIGLTAMVVIGLFHASLGLEVVIEDYVPLKKGRTILIYSVKGVLAAIALACFCSIIVTAFV